MFDAAGGVVSFANFFFTLLAFAEELEARGVRPGQTVAIRVTDRIAGTALKLAAMRLGARALVLLGEPGADASLPPLDWQVLAPGAAPGNARDIVFDAGWIRSPRRAVPIQGAGGLVKASSGTTGRPKLSFASDACLAARLARSGRERGLSGGPALIGYAPTSSPGTNMILRLLLDGALQLHLDGAPAAALAEAERHGATSLLAPPGSFRRLFDAAEAGAPRPRALRRIVLGGGGVAPEFARRAEALFGCEVINSYGSSETGAIAHSRPAETAPGIVGRPYDDLTLRFTAEDGSPADPATGGELWLRPPAALLVAELDSGRPLADAAGWVTTGDIARLLPDGRLQLLGRRAEFLNLGGDKRAPADFEEIARACPGVADVLAFRAPAAEGHDEVGLAVVPAPDFQMEGFCRHMAAALGPGAPFHVALLGQLPVTAAGKADRRGLTERFVAWRAAEQPRPDAED